MQIIKLLLATVCLLWITFAKCQTSQTVASSYVLESECNELILDLEIDAKIEIRKTAASRVSVEMTVQAKVPNDKMLSFLIAQGRYTIETLIDNNKGTIKLANKKNKSVLMVKGQECKEEFVYVIYVPHQIRFIKNANGTNLLGDNGAVSLNKG